MEALKELQRQLDQAKKATLSIQQLTDIDKQRLLQNLSRLLLEREKEIFQANSLDLERISKNDPNRDRLLLTALRIRELAASLLVIAKLPDPTRKVLYATKTPEGLDIKKITVPLGVVAVIYESRPNVTIDVAALCIRSGNVAIMRGGSDAYHTNLCLISIIAEVLSVNNLDTAIVQLVDPERELIKELLNASRFIDVVIPRGSQALIEFVRLNSSIPVIETGAGVCHTYIEKTANLDMALNIAINAKISRPSVCNALDTLLIDQRIAVSFLNGLAASPEFSKVEIFADESAWVILNQAGYINLSHAMPDDFGREFLDFKCSVKIVQNAAEAFKHISRYSSKHSEAIVTEDLNLQEKFLNEIDAAAVYINASTRFTDGSVFGLGAEIGISTQKLHARGPFALEKLVTEKWLVRGNGQVRN